MKSILTGIIGALVGVFLCALVGVNFSKSSESITDVPTDTAVHSQTSETWPFKKQAEDSLIRFNSQRLQSELSSCKFQLGSARMEVQMEKMKNFRQ